MFNVERDVDNEHLVSETDRFFAAIRDDDLEVFKRFIRDDFDYESFYPLHEACSEGCMSIVRYLGNIRTNVNAQREDGKTPLHLAVEYGHVDVVDFLLSEGADANLGDEDGNTPLHVAAETGTAGKWDEIAKSLVSHGADVNAKATDGKTPLHAAVQHGRVNIVKTLLEECTVNVDLWDEKGRTPLHYAVEQSDLNIMKILFGHRANIRDAMGRTPLHMAAKQGDKRIVEYLVDCGADPNSKDNSGMTPLHVAAEQGQDGARYASCKYAVIVKSLMRQADQNIQMDDGSTPLHTAVRNRNAKMVRILLMSGGTNADIPNKADLNPLEMVLHGEPKGLEEEIISEFRKERPRMFKNVTEQ